MNRVERLHGKPSDHNSEGGLPHGGANVLPADRNSTAYRQARLINYKEENRVQALLEETDLS